MAKVSKIQGDAGVILKLIEKISKTDTQTWLQDSGFRGEARDSLEATKAALNAVKGGNYSEVPTIINPFRSIIKEYRGVEDLNNAIQNLNKSIKRIMRRQPPTEAHFVAEPAATPALALA